MQAAVNLSLVGVAAQYGLNIKEIREDLIIAGSPDRTESRYAVEDDHDELFVPETIHRHTRPHKQRIIDALDGLSSPGIPGNHPYLRAAHQDSIIDFDGKNWQCTPCTSGFELNRPGYLHEAWRGDVVADFLINLHHDISLTYNCNGFSRLASSISFSTQGAIMDVPCVPSKGEKWSLS